jgi:predicted GNAT family acetyltransferase
VDIAVVDNPSSHRFEIHVDGRVAGFVRYRLEAEKIVFIHTEIDPVYEGKGLGSRLASGALDAARERSLEVDAQCPFIAAYLKRHPEYAQ